MANNASAPTVRADGKPPTWDAFLKFVTREKVTLLPYLAKATPPDCDDEEFPLCVPQGYYFDYLKDHAYLVDELASRFFQRTIHATVIAIGPEGTPVAAYRAKAPPVRVKEKGGKVPRSETVTVRLDPRLRYLAELASRKQRRTVSSFIEWAIETSLGHVEMSEDSTLASEANFLWDVNEAERFVMLALFHPYLLDHHQQLLWSLIRNTPFFWNSVKRNEARPHELVWLMGTDNLIKYRVRTYWSELNAVIRGEADAKCFPDPDLPPEPPGSDVPF